MAIKTVSFSSRFVPAQVITLGGGSEILSISSENDISEALTCSLVEIETEAAVWVCVGLNPTAVKEDPTCTFMSANTCKTYGIPEGYKISIIADGTATGRFIINKAFTI